MPILAREKDAYPDDLLDRPELGLEPGVGWWALYTLSRREKQLMRQLVGLEVAFYTPVVSRRKRSPSGRIRTTYAPLFPGYVFIYGTEEQRYLAMTTNCISRCLSVADGRRLTEDLRQIRRLIETGAPLTPESRLEPGMPVLIRSGSLTGLKGVVIKRQNETRLLVSVDFLKQGASVLLDDCQLERLD
jgi:transcription antitermination factor NusG